MQKCNIYWFKTYQRVSIGSNVFCSSIREGSAGIDTYASIGLTPTRWSPGVCW